MHRLKDLAVPEHVFQLCHPELPESFPELRSLDARPHNLPVQLTRFVGRESEIVEVTHFCRRADWSRSPAAAGAARRGSRSKWRHMRSTSTRTGSG